MSRTTQLAAYIDIYIGGLIGGGFQLVYTEFLSLFFTIQLHLSLIAIRSLSGSYSSR